jgi:hypothetical protein
MTTSRDPERLIHAFLLEGEDMLHDRVYDAVRAAIEVKRQRAVLGPWRTPIMNRFVTIGLGAAAVVLAIAIGAQILGSSNSIGGPGGEPTPTPQSTATPEPSPEPTSTPEAGLPEGPFPFGFEGASDRAPRVTVSIPAPGWTADAQLGALAKGDEVDNLPEAAILLYPEPAGAEFFVYGDPCRRESTTPETPATTADEIVAGLAAQASRDASEPVDVTIDGYSGTWITLHVPDDADFNECEGPEFATFGIDDDDLARYHQGPGQVDELLIVDVDGAIVIFDAMYRPDTPPELIEEMRSIAESATFELP